MSVVTISKEHLQQVEATDKHTMFQVITNDIMTHVPSIPSIAKQKKNPVLAR